MEKMSFAATECEEKKILGLFFLLLLLSVWGDEHIAAICFLSSSFSSYQMTYGGKLQGGG